MHQRNLKSSLKIESLQKSFPTGFWRQKREVIKDISFSVPVGGATGFVGSNGSGKTTTLKLMLGFLKPDSGSIQIFGASLNSRIKSQIGYLPERPFYYEHLTAREFLKFHWDLGGGGEGFADRCRDCFATVHLSHAADQRLRSFSKGMLQRVGMAQALIRNPRLLVLDEPMSGLDPDGRSLMKSIIQKEKEKGTTVFFSSHLLGDMEELCENIVIINRGKILFSGNLQDLVSRTELEYEIHWTESGSEKVCSENIMEPRLQSRIDEIRAQRGLICRLMPSHLGLEQAFSRLIQEQSENPHVSRER